MGGGVVPCRATIHQVADFLLYLLVERKLAPGTVEGYRTAISRVIELETGCALSRDRNMSALIRSFRLEHFVSGPKLPRWDLALVLRSLLKEPFEPITTCELKYLSYKTAFLLSLASASRISELHALDVRTLRLSPNWSRVTIATLPEFVAKNQQFGEPTGSLYSGIIKVLGLRVRRIRALAASWPLWSNRSVADILRACS